MQWVFDHGRMIAETTEGEKGGNWRQALHCLSLWAWGIQLR